ncbi:response regulator [Luteitalea sp.]
MIVSPHEDLAAPVPASGTWTDSVMAPIYAEGDRYCRYFILFHFAIGLALAPFYDTWLMAVVVGALAAAMFFGVAWLAPGTLLTRCIAGVSLQAFVALHIYQLHGQPEMHFFFFSAFTMLIAYQDWRAPWPGALLIIGQHIWFAYLENSGVEMNFFPGEVAFWQLFFHFGIAILHVAVCSHWAARLRRDTLREAWDQRRLDVALRKAEAGMVTRSRFLATMSHEIRTPMSGVLGMLTLLERTPLTDDQQEFLRIARRSGEGLLGVINDVLDFSKLEAGRVVIEQLPLDIRAILSDVHDLLLPQARQKGLALTTALPDVLPAELLGDGARIKQILLNLVGNALKFTAAGHVQVTASLEPLQASRVQLRLTVADTGIGMSADTVAGLFTEFTQADAGTTRRHGGTGLGLAISQRLARLLDGELAVATELGQGTTFTLVVPLTVDESAPARSGPIDAPDASVSALPLRVLVVEDHPVNQLVAVRLLEQESCVVTVAGNGLEALAAIEHTTFDLVLMDCHMPAMDGFDATRAIRAAAGACQAVPIVALTASVMEEDRARCLAAGMNGVLAKPVSRLTLQQLLQQHRQRVGVAPAAPAA